MAALSLLAGCEVAGAPASSSSSAPVGSASPASATTESAPAPVAAEVAAAPARHAGCTSVEFIGLRGSGEPADPDQHNMGDVVFRTYEEFEPRARYAGLKVNAVGLDASEYPATDVLALRDEAVFLGAATSVQQGVVGLSQHLVPYLRPDPVRDATCIVLVGYSQGAWVIGDYFEQFDPEIRARIMGRISAVVLYGDPRFDRTAQDVAQGSLDESGVLRASWIGRRLPMPGTYYQASSDRVRSYCADGDPVCNFRGWPALESVQCTPLLPKDEVHDRIVFQGVFCHHLHYVPGVTPGWTGEGSTFLFEKVTGPASDAGGQAKPDTGTVPFVCLGGAHCADTPQPRSSAFPVPSSAPSTPARNEPSGVPSAEPPTAGPETAGPDVRPPSGAPTFSYPDEGETLSYETPLEFGVDPVPGASGYLWGFFQNGAMVWENNRDEHALGESEYAIRPGSAAHDAIEPGSLEVWVRAMVDGAWTDATIRKIILE